MNIDGKYYLMMILFCHHLFDTSIIVSETYY